MSDLPIIAWLDKIAGAALAGSAPVGGALANLQVNPGIARFAGPSFNIDVDAGAATAWEAFAALPARQGFDLSPASTVRVMLSNVAPGGLDVFDTGVVAAGIVDGYGEVYVVLPAAFSARYVRLAFADAGTATLDVKRLVGYGGAGLWRPTFGHSLGRGLRWVHAGALERTQGGQLLGATDASWRELDFAVEDHDGAEMKGSALELARALGLDGDALVMLQPDLDAQRESVFGPLVRTQRLVRTGKLVDSMAFEFEERL